MRRRVSLAALCLAWLCANGAIWNAVQIVAWAKMFRDYSQVMPLTRALEITFSGNAPCNLCKIAGTARDAARNELPREAALGAGDKLVLAFQAAVPLVLTAPDPAWADVVDRTGLARTEPVPVPPPRV